MSIRFRKIASALGTLAVFSLFAGAFTPRVQADEFYYPVFIQN